MCDMPSSMRLTTIVNGAAGDGGQIGQRRQPEGKADGDADQHANADQHHEEHDEIGFAHRLERRGRQTRTQCATQGHQERCDRRSPPSRTVSNMRISERTIISANADRYGRDLGRGRPLERRRADDRLAQRLLDGEGQHPDEEDDRHDPGERIEQAAQAWRRPHDEGGQAHVLASLQRDHRAEHGEPQEQDRGELVRPGERTAHQAADDTAEQHQRLDQDDERCHQLDRAGNAELDPRPAMAGRRALASPPR